MMKQTEFKLLSYFAKNTQTKETQRALCKKFDISPGTVNNVLNSLIAEDLISQAAGGV